MRFIHCLFDKGTELAIAEIFVSCECRGLLARNCGHCQSPDSFYQTNALDLDLGIQWHAKIEEALGGSQEALILGFKGHDLFVAAATVRCAMLPITKIVSGVQRGAGADRAALDWAVDGGLPHGGWCPKGRKAEDGPIDDRHQLQETGSARNGTSGTATFVLSHAVIARPIGNDGRPFFNPVFWIVEKEGDLPDWFTVENPRLRHIPMPTAFAEKLFVAESDLKARGSAEVRWLSGSEHRMQRHSMVAPGRGPPSRHTSPFRDRSSWIAMAPRF